MSENPDLPTENINEKDMEKQEYSELSQAETKSSNKGLILGLIIAVGAGAFFAGMFFANTGSETVTKSEFDQAISRIETKIDNLQMVNTPLEIVKISKDDDPIRGDKNAPITIIEFSDYQCPFCARFHTQTLPVLLDEYINSGKVNLVYRDFPIQNIHPNALPAAVAAECADEQGRYWEYHDMLFENQNSWAGLEIGSAVAAFKQYAVDLNLSQDQFESCLDSGKYLEEIRKDLNDGRDYGVSGTPGFFIGNDQIGYVQVSGAQPFEAFKQIIDSQLNT